MLKIVNNMCMAVGVSRHNNFMSCRCVRKTGHDSSREITGKDNEQKMNTVC
jgi:hypothetical protein